MLNLWKGFPVFTSVSIKKDRFTKWEISASAMHHGY